MSRLPFAVIVTVSATGGTVEQHRVAAVLALDHVAAVARIPAEGVLPAARGRRCRCPCRRRPRRCLCRPCTSRRRSPPFSESLPSPPAIVVGMESVNAPFVSSTRTESWPSPIVTSIALSVAARERAVGRAVVAYVDLDPVRVAGLQAKRDGIGAVAALDLERAALDRGPYAATVVARVRARWNNERREREGDERCRCNEGEWPAWAVTWCSFEGYLRIGGVYCSRRPRSAVLPTTPRNSRAPAATPGG